MKKKLKSALEERALGYLVRREYSREELKQKLLPFANDSEPLDALLYRLTAKGFLSDSRYTQQIIFARQKKFGLLRIHHELRDKGVAPALIDEALLELRGSEVSRAFNVWQRKFGNLPKDSKERAKHFRFMQSRGFAVETIQAVLQRVAESEKLD